MGSYKLLCRCNVNTAVAYYLVCDFREITEAEQIFRVLQLTLNIYTARNLNVAPKLIRIVKIPLSYHSSVYSAD